MSHQIIIQAGKSHSHYLRDLWHYRELFYILAWRDIIVRYKQTVIGVAWSVIRPLLGMIVFTVIFSKIAKLPSDGTNYFLMVYAGIMIWQFFSNTLTIGSESLLDNQNLITKVYFPRLILPATGMTVSLTDFIISSIVFLPLLLYYHWRPGWEIALLPAALVLIAVISLGSTFFLAALNVKYRDFRYALPFAVQLGMYLSPVGFSGNIVPEQWKFWFYLNPVAGAIELMRYAMFGAAPYWPGIAAAAVIGVGLLTAGFFFFRNMEREFADVI